MKTCKIDGCGRATGVPGTARGWCDRHYRRWRRHGDPLAGKRGARLPDADILAWLLNQTEQRGACRIWTGRTNAGGYGSFKLAQRGTLVHRWICRLFHGTPPDGKPFAIHSCDRPACVNPDHLRWGSQQDNVADRVDRGRGADFSGERNPRAKLTEMDVRVIRYLSSRGVSTRWLAAEHGVGTSTIRSVARGETWGSS